MNANFYNCCSSSLVHFAYLGLPYLLYVLPDNCKRLSAFLEVIVQADERRWDIVWVLAWHWTKIFQVSNLGHIKLSIF